MTCRKSAPEAPGRRRFLTGAASATAAGLALPVAGSAEPSQPGQNVVVDGVPLCFERRGSGPPVVLIHGASGNLRDWDFGVVAGLAESRTVIAFDRPGHGLSGWPEDGGRTLRTQASLMRRALAAMGVERPLVVGHSYGGAVALAWALDAPASVNGLVVIGAPSQVWPDPVATTTALLAHPLVGPVLARAAPLFVTDAVAERVVAGVFAPQAPPEGYLARLRRDLLLRPTTLRRNALQVAALKDQVRAMVPLYPDLGVPVEIVHGTADATVPHSIHALPLASQIPDARLTLLDGVGHMPHHAAMPEVLAAVGRIG